MLPSLSKHTRLFVTTLGVTVGPLLLGLIHDLADGYFPAFLLAVALSLPAGFILLAGGDPPELSAFDSYTQRNVG